MPKQLYLFLYFAFIVSSCNEKLKVGQKPTNLKGWVEYQKKLKNMNPMTTISWLQRI